MQIWIAVVLSGFDVFYPPSCQGPTICSWVWKQDLTQPETWLWGKGSNEQCTRLYKKDKKNCFDLTACWRLIPVCSRRNALPESPLQSEFQTRGLVLQIEAKCFLAWSGTHPSHATSDALSVWQPQNWFTKDHPKLSPNMRKTQKSFLHAGALN